MFPYFAPSLLSIPAHLDHKVANDAMEGRSLITESHLVRAQLFEVFCRFRHHLAEQSDYDPADFFIADLNIKVYLVRHLWVLRKRGTQDGSDQNDRNDRSNTRHHKGRKRYRTAHNGQKQTTTPSFRHRPPQSRQRRKRSSDCSCIVNAEPAIRDSLY